MTTDNPTGHLVLIDGLNIARRVYEANPAPDSADKAQSAVRNSLSSFRRVLEEHQPTHVLAPFDFGGTTWRHALYPDYRKKRKPMPAELREVLPDLYEKLNAMGIPTISVPGVEADDVLATVFGHWAMRGKATIVSTDKDLAVLVAQGAGVRDHFNMEWRDEAWILNKFGVVPGLLHDLLALTGDSSDDIPGVDKIGTKSAAKLLNQFGSLDGVLANADQVKGVQGENLRASTDIVKLARQLVAFKTDMQLGLTWRALRYPAGQP
jgi:DNA polymerase-1